MVKMVDFLIVIYGFVRLKKYFEYGVSFGEN